MQLSDDDKKEFFQDDDSSQVAISMDILTDNDKLTPEQREAIFNGVVMAARQMIAKVMFLGPQGTVKVRMERRSSSTGTFFIDLYDEQ